MISRLTTLNHGLMRHLNITDRLIRRHLKVHSASQIICVDFTKTHSLQHGKARNAHRTTDVDGAIYSDDECAQHHWEEGKSVRKVHETTLRPSILSNTEKRVDIGSGTHQSPHWQHALDLRGGEKSDGILGDVGEVKADTL